MCDNPYAEPAGKPSLTPALPRSGRSQPSRPHHIGDATPGFAISRSTILTLVARAPEQVAHDTDASVLCLGVENDPSERILERLDRHRRTLAALLSSIPDAAKPQGTVSAVDGPMRHAQGFEPCAISGLSIRHCPPTAGRRPMVAPILVRPRQPVEDSLLLGNVGHFAPSRLCPMIQVCKVLIRSNARAFLNR